MPIQPLKDFFRLESAAGLLLMGAAALAILVSNSPLASWYDALLSLPFTVAIGEAALSKPLLLWINDGLMAFFFLLVGLEIKREVAGGHLSDRESLILPAVAAFGGMALPAGIFVAVAWSDPAALNGWAVPAATDIAFALGVMALLGSRVPISLKVLLTAVAVIDDLGAIVVIAVFYTSDLSLLSLVLASVCLAGLFALNRWRVDSISPYAILGLIMWVCVLKSGVHATLAGVALGLLIPLRRRDNTPFAADIEHRLHPWIAYVTLPLFAFANAGLPLFAMDPAMALGVLPLGVAAGLFLGKQLGVFGGAWLAIRLGWAQLPDGASWRGLYGMACLTGIGFTMSLFIGGLAFDDAESINAIRLGVLAGSLASAALGAALLATAPQRPSQ